MTKQEEASHESLKALGVEILKNKKEGREKWFGKLKQNIGLCEKEKIFSLSVPVTLKRQTSLKELVSAI